MANSTELVTEFTFKGSTKPLENFNLNMTDAIGLLAKGTALFTAGAIALNGFVISTLAGADAQGQLANTLGVSIEEIQKLGFVASVSGSSAAQLESSLEGINERIGEASIKGSETFNRLGISVRGANGEVKKADKVLLEVRDSFERLNLSSAEQSKILSELGIDKSLQQSLNLTRQQIADLGAEAEAFGLMDEEDTKKVIEFNDSLTKLTFGFDSLRKMVAISLAPQITGISDGFSNFLKVNKDLIVNGIGKTFEVLNAGLGAISRVGSAFITMIDKTIGLDNALIGLGGAIAFINRGLLFSPIGLAVAGLTALFVIVDDLIVAFEGGNSIIADFFQDVFDIDIVEGITKSFNFLKESLVSLMEFFKPVLDAIKLIGSSIGGLFGFGADTPNVPHGTTAPQEEEGFFSNLKNDIGNLLGGGTSTSSNTSNVQQSNVININTNDPQLAGQSVVANLDQSYEQAKFASKKGNF